LEGLPESLGWRKIVPMARKNFTRLQGLVNGFMASRGTFHLHFVVGVVGRLEVGLFFFSSLSFVGNCHYQ